MAVSRYGTGIIEWTKEEVRSLGRVTRKTMTMNGKLLPKGDVERLFVRTKLKAGGECIRSLTIIETEENVSKNKFKRDGMRKRHEEKE